MPRCSAMFYQSFSEHLLCVVVLKLSNLTKNMLTQQLRSRSVFPDQECSEFFCFALYFGIWHCKGFEVAREKGRVPMLVFSDGYCLAVFGASFARCICSLGVFGYIHIPRSFTFFVCVHYRESMIVLPPKGGRGFLMSPPCLESQGCPFDPTFLYLLSCSSA